MKRANFTIKGQPSSFMLFSAEPPFEDAPGKPGPKVKDEAPRKVAESHLHRDRATGKIAIPAHNLRKALQHAISFMPRRRGVSMKKMANTLMVEPAYLTLTPQTWTIDARRSGAGAMNYRPRFDDWACSGAIEYDEEIFSDEQIRALLDYAGKYSGLGAWRFGNGGPCGRFQVTEWRT